MLLAGANKDLGAPNRVGICDSVSHVKTYLVEYATNNISACMIFIVNAALIAFCLALFTACLLQLHHNHSGTFLFQNRHT